MSDEPEVKVDVDEMGDSVNPQYPNMFTVSKVEDYSVLKDICLPNIYNAILL